jgi:hypothetical protein
VGFRAGLEVEENRKTCSRRDLNPGRPARSHTVKFKSEHDQNSYGSLCFTALLYLVTLLHHM